MTGASVAVTFRARWNDGFGARGWKLDVAMGEGEVIAATPYTGDRIPTSVLVHDILDHWVPGFPLAGHRAEAKALVQLAARTGSDPIPDYGQMVDEDLLRGDCSGEALDTFLPPVLAQRLPAGGADRERMAALTAELGTGLVRATLVGRFLALGWAAMPEVPPAWAARGLDYRRRLELGLALQRLLEWADARVVEQGWEGAHGWFRLGSEAAAFTFDEPVADRREEPVAAP